MSKSIDDRVLEELTKDRLADSTGKIRKVLTKSEEEYVRRAARLAYTFACSDWSNTVKDHATKIYMILADEALR